MSIWQYHASIGSFGSPRVIGGTGFIRQAVLVAKKRSGPPTGRLMWTNTGSRLWDRAGVEWEDTGEELTRDDAEAMINRPDVQVAMSVGTASLKWLDGAQRRRVWRDEVVPNFHDQPGWRPPRSAPGQLPFHATLWSNGDRRLVLITDYD